MAKKIIVENTVFDYDLGCRLLKLKHSECPFPELEDVWEHIEPLSFKEIAKFKNLEERRVGILCLGIEKLVKEINPKLVNSVTLKKNTTWINEKGELETKAFDDTYELYKVEGKHFTHGLERWQRMEDCYYIKCKDTSTDREYLIWVDIRSVYRTNIDSSGWNIDVDKINAIQCIAWTIQTNVPEGDIKEIIRQGDCILIKPNGEYKPLDEPRHLTEKEYRKLLVAES